MLGKHYSAYPRFRDCFVGRLENDETKTDQFGIPQKKNLINKKQKEISVYTRVGGGNRDEYEKEIKELRSIPEYITDYDDDFDCTFATFVFKCPTKWEKDFDLVCEGELKKISKEYLKQLYKIYPKLKDKFDEFFG